LTLIAPAKLVGYINSIGRKIRFVSNFIGSADEPGIEILSHNFDEYLTLTANTATNGTFIEVYLDPITEMQEESGKATLKLSPKLFVGADKALGIDQRVTFTVRETDNAEYAKIYCENTDSEALSLIDLGTGSDSEILTGILAAIATGDIPSQSPTPTTGAQGVWCEEIALHTVRPLIAAILNSSQYTPWIGNTNAYSVASLSWTPPPEFVTQDIANEIPGYDGIYIVTCDITGVDGSTNSINFMVRFKFSSPPL
jgi:hypothetical protein